MFRHIVVKDYPYDGVSCFGSWDDKEGCYWMDDGDLFSVEQIKQRGHAFVLLTSNMIVDVFRDKCSLDGGV